MTAITFDTLQYYEKLKDAGFTEKQARVQVEAMQGVVRSYDESTRKELATKGDIQAVRSELKQDLADTKHEILKWMISLMVAQGAIIVTAIGIGVAVIAWLMPRA